MDKFFEICVKEFINFEKKINISNCQITLQSLPFNIQKELCSNPLMHLMQEENIFSFGVNFFQPYASQKMGCNLLTHIMLYPIFSIQKQACSIINYDVSQNNLLLQSLENLTSNQCSLTLNNEELIHLENCLPNFNIGSDIEQKKNTLLKNLASCDVKIIELPVGARIKLCDDIIKALNLYSPSSFSHTTSFHFKIGDLKSVTEKRLLAALSFIKNIKNVNFEKIITEKLLQYRKLERRACLSLNREDNFLKKEKPLYELINKVCFLDTTETMDPCFDIINQLEESDKKNICFESSNLNVFQESYYFENSLAKIKRICHKIFNPATHSLPSNSTNENISEVLKEIKLSNQENGTDPTQFFLNTDNGTDDFLAVNNRSGFFSTNSSDENPLYSYQQNHNLYVNDSITEEVQLDSTPEIFSNRFADLAMGFSLGFGISTLIGGIAGYCFFKRRNQSSVPKTSNREETDKSLDLTNNKSILLNDLERSVPTTSLTQL